MVVILLRNLALEIYSLGGQISRFPRDLGAMKAALKPPVAEGGPASYEGYLGDTPKTLFIFLATPYPLR
jgi:hypothetical protein